MTPLYFGTSTRRLFGVYHPARGRARRRAVVLCHPWGAEYIRAHRAMRHFSRLLADAGFDVLRFDYFGTGDSAGELPEANLDGWLEDIETAIEEVMDTTGVSKVTLAGLRLGATLAAAAAARGRRRVDTLVLWEPIHDGAEYVAALRSETSWVQPRALEEGGGHEISGFELSAAMAGQIEALRLAELEIKGISTLVLRTTADPAASGSESPADRIPGPAVACEYLADERPWEDEDIFGSRPLPIKVLHRMVEWLS
jgi:exosortase A-associated hydrolase 2